MAGLIPTTELTALRAAAAAALDISGVQIQSYSKVDNGDGTFGETWTTTATVAASQAKPSAGIMAAYSDLIGSATSYVMRVPYGTAFAANNRVVMPGTGETLRIQADLSDSSYSTCALFLAVRIQP